MTLVCVECDTPTRTAYEWLETTGMKSMVCPRCYGDKDTMPEWTPHPDGVIRKPKREEREALRGHRFHDTPNTSCLACVWETTI